MSDSAAELQKTIYTTLMGDVPLMATITGVYDFVPQGTDYPYITIGEDTTLDISDKDEDETTNTLTLHVWTQSEGRLQGKQIAALVHNVLHRAELTITGFTSVYSYFEFYTSFRDPDGLTYHHVLRYRIRIGQ